MTKKNEKKKIIKQNKRNYLRNRKYISSIKKFFKKIKKTITNIISLTEEFSKNEHKNQVLSIRNILFSLLDKSATKGIIHKNTAARKKSIVTKLLKSI